MRRTRTVSIGSKEGGREGGRTAEPSEADKQAGMAEAAFAYSAFFPTLFLPPYFSAW